MDDQTNVYINIKVSKFGEGLGLQQFDKRFVVGGEHGKLSSFHQDSVQRLGVGHRAPSVGPDVQ